MNTSASRSVSVVADAGVSKSKRIENIAIPNKNFVAVETRFESQKHGHEILLPANNIAPSRIASSSIDKDLGVKIMVLQSHHPSL